MAIHLERPHHLNAQAAREQVAEVVEEIAPLIRAKYQWEGDRMTFRGRGVKGAIEVDDEMVRVEVVRSPLLPVSEKWLLSKIEERLDAHFPPPVDPAGRPPAPENSGPADDSPSASEAEQVSAETKHEGVAADEASPSDAPGEKADDESSEPPVAPFISPLVDLAEETTEQALKIASLASKASFRLARNLLRTEDDGDLSSAKD